MIRETYKGQEIRTARGAKRGTVKLTINGVVFDDRVGTEERVLRSAKGAIDNVEQRIADGRPYGGRWYVAAAAGGARA